MIKHLLFICTGNTCRSPMAEYLFRRTVGTILDIRCSSAGLSAADGAPASPNALNVMNELGIDMAGHRSRSLTREMIDEADLIVVMTSAHRDSVCRFFPDAGNRVRLFHSFGVHHTDRDVNDPFGQSAGRYRETRDELSAVIPDMAIYLNSQGATPLKNAERICNMKIAIGSDHGGFELKKHLIQFLSTRNLDVLDQGCAGTDAVDYPDYAGAVAVKITEGRVDMGIVICTTGIGVSIVANKFPRVRAALCTTPKMAQLARAHNNANVLALGAALTSPEEAEAIVTAWLNTEFEAGGRHERRVAKIQTCMNQNADPVAIYDTDPEIYNALRSESKRQRENLELIASENYASRAVRDATGSIMTNKYAEGYPAKRWYNGCEFVDAAERLALDRAIKLFGAEQANVQPHSGSQANMAVYFTVLNPGDTILAMSLADGGHLTHGNKMNFSGRMYNIVSYGVSRQTETIDYDEVQKLAEQHNPKLIVAGASAYSRIINFKRLRQIADGVGALLMVDMAHIAGLVAAGCHPNPVPYCDFVTTTTHKTLRGPRGGMILCQERFAADINRQVFPGIQGGPLMHVIAAKAVCFEEALQPSFKDYAQQVVKNAQALSTALQDAGLRIVSGGTDNHMMLVDLSPIDVTGKDAATALDKACITVNKNAIPFDTKSPFVTSGVRLGTAALTTRGMKEDQMHAIAGFIVDVLKNCDNEKIIDGVRSKVIELTAGFPVP